MKNKYLAAISLLLFVSAFGAAMSAKAQSVTGSIGNGTVAKGVASRATVVLSIPGGLHVNSNRPNGEYQIPTTVRASGNGVRIGSVTYPRGRNRKFSFSETSLNVYEGRATFNFNVTVPATFKGSSVSVRVAVKYQACTNEVCYPPKTKDITLTAKVR
jgi:thiol:disulfide interchange protein